MPKTDERQFTYQLDAEDRIEHVSPEWLAFAEENDAPELSEQAVLGTPLFDWIADPDTRHLYHVFLDRVREGLPAITIPFRCDSPDTKRFMEMRLRATDGGGVELCCSVRSLVTRDAVKLLDNRAARSSAVLEACSFCKRLNVESEGWLETDVAVARLDLFAQPAMPRLSHGVCDDCTAELHRRLQM
jgi:hypothetical protein